jgi:hypothetical protein
MPKLGNLIENQRKGPPPDANLLDGRARMRDHSSALDTARNFRKLMPKVAKRIPKRAAFLV